MTEIRKLTNELLKFNNSSDYSVSDNTQGGRLHTIYSEGLKQSLREIIHSKASEEWQIKHTVGENFVEYGIEQNGEFGLYRKNLVANSPDEFLMVLEGQNSPEREEFTSADRDCEESWQKIEMERKKIEMERKKIEMIRQKNNQGNKSLESNILGDNCISITFQKNEEGGRLVTKEEHYNDLNKAQEIREGWGYNFTKQMLSEWAQKQKDKVSREVIQKVLEDDSDNKEFKQKKTDENPFNSNKKNNSENVYYGVGLVCLIILVMSMVVVWVKRKKMK